MYNIVLHDAQIAALQEERQHQMEDLAVLTTTEACTYMYRVGSLRGLDVAIEIMEGVRKRYMES